MSSHYGNVTVQLTVQPFMNFCFKQNIDADATNTKSCAVCMALAHAAPLQTLVNQGTAYACP